jgi:hypothetical protein
MKPQQKKRLVARRFGVRTHPIAAAAMPVPANKTRPSNDAWLVGPHIAMMIRTSGTHRSNE